jgi:lysophospholipase L1-like esterase
MQQPQSSINTFWDKLVFLVYILFLTSCGGSNGGGDGDTGSGSGPQIPIFVNNACFDTPLNIILTRNLNEFVSGDLTEISFSSVVEPKNGSVLINPTTGEFTYTPNPGTRGLDSFTYEVKNQSGASANATVEIIVAQTRIMPLGDSITKGVTQGLTEAIEDPKAPSDKEMVGYRAKLYADLLAKGYKIDFVGSESNGLGATPAIGDADHEGHGGFEDGQVATAVFDWLNGNPADIVLLHIGTNGLADAGGTASSDVEMILNEIDRWEAASSTPVAVFLAKIIEVKDITNNDAIPNPNVAMFNTNLETLVLGPGGNGGGRVDTAGDDITMVNQHDALMYPDDLSTDLVHPLPSGYEKMANTWLEALDNSQKLPSCTTGN